MLTISKYQVKEKIYQSHRSVVYTAYRLADNVPVILKTLQDNQLSPERVAWFKREYDIIRSFDIPQIIKVYDLFSQEGQWVICLEDFGGESLTKLNLAGQMSLITFLKLTLNIVQGIAQIHQHHVIHKDINPANVVFNPTSGQVKLIDFGISTKLSRETPTFRNPNVLEGTLAYMSPEQTGRMNRPIDYRTDFYSLGIMLYELLTGQHPFPSNDPLELVHWHTAKLPLPPYNVKSDIPLPVSDIVMKLIAKNATDRYQSAYGLIEDLAICLNQLEAGTSIAPFQVGQQDFVDHLKIPATLYGRVTEIKTLLLRFEQVSRGSTEIILVSGQPGVGKSTLVKEIYKPITRQRGYFISGKFDQFQQNSPYASLIQAFQSLVKLILTESELEVARWREKLLTVLGHEGQVIAEVIPDIGLIIGPQPKLPRLPSTEADNRFKRVFPDFIKAFAQQTHPLVIFLDDLQWADYATLNLLVLLLTAADAGYLLVIGAYRTEEVNATHPLFLTIDTIKKTSIIFNELNLMPLALPDVSQFVADILHTTPLAIQPLAELILSKTKGNPFFMGEFLNSLYEDALLKFDHKNHRWTWDLDQIQQHGITDNVVSLMTAKIQRLPTETQQVLYFAACIGNQFELKTLALVYQKDIITTARHLWQAILEGLIIPLGDMYKYVETGSDVTSSFTIANLEDETRNWGEIAYKFVHDRVQQTVYHLTPSGERKSTHWLIGNVLLKHIPLSERHKRIFEIIHHLNLGYVYQTEARTERFELARLNLLAGRKAKNSAAYQPALTYFKRGILLLTSQPADESYYWDTAYKVTLALHVEAIDTAFLNKDLTTMDNFANIVLEKATNLLDKIKVYEIKIEASKSQQDLSQAIELSKFVLELLNIKLPKQFLKGHILWQLLWTNLNILITIWRIQFKYRRLFAANGIKELSKLPSMSDHYTLATIRILARTASLVYLTQPDLIPLVVFKMVQLSLKQGNAAESAFAYSTYGLILCGVVGDIDRGYQFGKMAVSLIEQSRVKTFKAKVLLIFNHFINPWKTHVRDCLDGLLTAYKSGVETGDLEYGALGAYVYCYNLWATGYVLSHVNREMIFYDKVLGKLVQYNYRHRHQLFWQSTLNLMGQNDVPWLIQGEQFDEVVFLAKSEERDDANSVTVLHIQKLYLAFLFKQVSLAKTCADQARENLNSLVGDPFLVVFYFFDSLTCLAIASAKSTDLDKITQSEHKQILRRVAANQRKLKKWATHAPMNYLHKFYLVQAEQQRVQGNHKITRDLYDQAIRLAYENQYLNDQALANELAGRWYADRGEMRLARHYIEDAWFAYQHWGAVAKVKQLEETYTELLARTKTVLGRMTSATISTTTAHTSAGLNSSQGLDVITFLKTAQTIGGEIVLEKLLMQLIKFVIENAGAERGVFILKRGSEWFIEAEGHVNQSEILVLQAQSLEASVEKPLLPLSLINYVAHTKKDVILPNATFEGPFTEDDYIILHQAKSILCTPLISRGKLVGLLYLENNLTPDVFTEKRLEILNLLSAQMAIAIENAQLYTTLEGSEKKYRTLFEDSEDTIFISDIEGNLLDVNQAGIQDSGYSRTELLQMKVQDLYVDSGNQSKFLRRLLKASSIRNFEIQLQRKDGTVRDELLTASLRRGEDGQIIGYQGILRDVTDQKRAQEERLQLLSIQRELNIAHEIQQSLLPPSNPDWADMKMICYNIPAHDVGGDFYSYFTIMSQAIPDEDIPYFTKKQPKYGVAVGDVSGKGVSAALLMAISLSQFDATRSLTLSPTQRLVHLDRNLSRYTTHYQNCALCYVEISPPSPNTTRQGRIEVVNAACIPPYLKRTNGEVIWLEAGGFALGQSLGFQTGYQAITAPLNSGDLIILTSDGVVEAKNATDQIFGFERLETALASAPTTNPLVLLNHLKDSLSAFVGQTEPHDDLTIVIIQV